MLKPSTERLLQIYLVFQISGIVLSALFTTVMFGFMVFG
jgi:hypothetical protein